MKTQDMQYIRASSSSTTSSGQQVRRNSLTSAINSVPMTAHASRAYPLTSSMLSPTPFPLSSTASAVATPLSANDPLATPLAPATHSRTNPVRDPGYKGEYTVSLTPAVNALHETLQLQQQQQRDLKLINSDLTSPQTPPTNKRKSPPPHPLDTDDNHGDHGSSEHPHEEGEETNAINPLATPPKKKTVYTGSLHGMPLTPGTKTAIYELSPASAKQHFMRSVLQRQHNEALSQEQPVDKDDEQPQQLSFSEETVAQDTLTIESTTLAVPAEEVVVSSPLPQNTSVRFADPLSMLLTTPPPPCQDTDTTMTTVSAPATGLGNKDRESAVINKGVLSPVKTPTGPQQGSWVDGMVFCLIMLDKCFQERQNRYYIVLSSYCNTHLRPCHNIQVCVLVFSFC